MARKQSKFEPMTVYDRMGYLRLYHLAAAKEGEVIHLLMNDATRYDVFAREVLEGQVGAHGRFAVSSTDPAITLAALKGRALKHGATPEAIRLLGLLTPISKEEYKEMAKDTKLAPKKGDATALKDAAKKAPVGGKKETAPAKARGNPEALAKARAINESKKAEQLKDKRKILLTDKGKEKVKNGDSTKGSIANLVAMRDAKTVGGAITNGLNMADINYAVKTGTIELS